MHPRENMAGVSSASQSLGNVNDHLWYLEDGSGDYVTIACPMSANGPSAPTPA